MDVFELIGGEVSSDEDEEVIEKMTGTGITNRTEKTDKEERTGRKILAEPKLPRTDDTNKSEDRNPSSKVDASMSTTNNTTTEKKKTEEISRALKPGNVSKIYFIGLGLGSEKDITVRGLEAVRACDAVFLEAYTSILPGVDVSKLESFYGKSVRIADRDLVESGSDEMLKYGAGATVALLVVGDPFGATTHSDLYLRAQEMNIDVEIVHNASIMNAVGCCGLQLYRFGHTVSIPFFREKWKPDSFYDAIRHNRAGGLHTLCLLDIKVKEPDYDALVKTGRKSFLAPRYMTANVAIEQLLYVESVRKEKLYGPDTTCVAVARIGQRSQRIVAGPMKAVRNVDMGGPLHSMILVGEAHDFEEKMLKCFWIDEKTPLLVGDEKE